MFSTLQKIKKISGKFLLALNFDPRKKTHIFGSSELKVIHGCAMIVELLLQVCKTLLYFHKCQFGPSLMLKKAIKFVILRQLIE